MAQMPQVLVLGVVGFSGNLQRHIVGLCVVDLLLAALDAPLAPGRDNGHLRGQPLDGQLKTDLIVALAGTTVGNGVRALFLSDFHQMLGDNGAGKGGTQQVIFILCAHHHGGDDDVVHHLVHHILNIQLGRAGLDGLFLQALQLVALAHVGGHCNDLRIIVIFLQPGNNDGCIQTARVGQYDFLDFFLTHNKNLHWFMFIKGSAGTLCIYITTLCFFMQ